MANTYLLFDLDGTLTDPALGITNAVSYALRSFGLTPRSREELYPYIGPPLFDAFQENHGLSPEQARRAVAEYRVYFAQKGLYENSVYPGIRELLQSLCAEGYTLIVATSKPEEFACRILQHFSLDRYFALIAGNTLQDDRPKKSDVIAYVRSRFPDISAQDALMIGDRRYDIEGARDAGLPAIGVLYGYGSEQELRAAQPAAVAADLEQLGQQIRTLLPR